LLILIVEQIMIHKINTSIVIVFEPGPKVSVDTLDRLW
jgi:hypothetical protein